MEAKDAVKRIIEHAEDLIFSHTNELDDDAELSIHLLKDAIHDYKNGE